jgi:hypothetical protein
MDIVTTVNRQVVGRRKSENSTKNTSVLKTTLRYLKQDVFDLLTDMEVE